MQYRMDGKSGNRLSVLGFGCMRFPRKGTSIDMGKTERLIMEAVNRGVNYFDTAYIYGGSEEALGHVLEKNKVRDKVFIATKLPLILARTPADFDRFFNKSLERLRTDRIDYYLLHMLTGRRQWEKFRDMGIEEWIAEQKKAGRIDRAGFSFHGSQEEFIRLLDVYDWEFCQIQYNYAQENYQAGKTGLLKAAAKGLPVIVMEPLLGGKLAAALPRQAEEVFRASGKKAAERALRWVWNHKEATVVLSGMNDPAQLEENLLAAEDALPGSLTAGEQEAYRRVMEIFGASYKIPCTGCNYCMPCPQHVNIPGCFAAYNTSFALGWVQGMQQYVTSATLTAEQAGGSGLCVKCGKCESRCPQHIPVVKSLEAVRKRMEPLPFRGILGIIRTVLGHSKGKIGSPARQFRERNQGA
ncbi:MAG: aldo/keto reductase [Treponema sp.]|nr:aldo/keto reductase [Treponema sp.]